MSSFLLYFTDFETCADLSSAAVSLGRMPRRSRPQQSWASRASCLHVLPYRPSQSHKPVILTTPMPHQTSSCNFPVRSRTPASASTLGRPTPSESSLDSRCCCCYCCCWPRTSAAVVVVAACTSVRHTSVALLRTQPRVQVAVRIQVRAAVGIQGSPSVPGSTHCGTRSWRARSTAARPRTTVVNCSPGSLVSSVPSPHVGSPRTSVRTPARTETVALHSLGSALVALDRHIFHPHRIRSAIPPSTP